MTARATLALLVALLLWLPLAAQAQQRQVVVKSGEHPGFSRLVLDLPPRFTWQLEPVAGGYDLVLSPAEVSFDLGQVFRLIPRTRLLAITSEGASRLRLKTAENVQPVVFRNETGRALVIDLKEAPDVAATATTPAPGATTLAPLRAPAPLRRYTPQVPPPPGLEVFWQQTAPAPARKAPDQAALRSTTPASPPDTPREAARVMPPAAAAPLLLPTLPNPRAVALEDELLRSLGRAASQGLIRLETPQFDVAEVAPPAPAAPKPPPEPAPTEEAPAPATPEVAPEDPAELERQMHIHVDTSIDRAQAEDPPLPALTNAGATCPAEETVDIGAWADDSDFALQLAERQKALLGEFDRPEPEAVVRLARFYIAKGFGAEARAVLSNFPLPAREATPLRAIADIIDEGQATDPGAFAGFAECDNGAALWAVLARPRIAPGESVNTAAVLRSFSAMPLSLRELLGPGLADRLIAKGDTDSARMVRDSILRATETPGDGLRIIDARLATDPATPGGTGALANSELTTIAESNDPRAPEALVLLVDRLLASGVTIPDTQIETAAALAFEQRDGPQGPALARAQVLGLASAGRFDEAFGALQRLAGNWPKSVSRDLARELFTMLAAQKDELPFMTNFLSHRGQFSAADPPPALRLQVARRLLDAGLADEATASLGVAVANSPEGQLIAAQAALLAQDGRTAIAILAGRNDAAAARLQAEAHAQLGDFNAAAEAYRRAGDPEAAAAAAWRAGDWAQAQEGASEAQRSVIGLGLPGTSPAPAPAEAPQPSLAASRQLLQDSEAARNAWQALISGAPASNP